MRRLHARSPSNPTNSAHPPDPLRISVNSLFHQGDSTRALP